MIAEWTCAMDDLERAVRDLQQVLEANPRDVKTHCLLGAIQDRLGQKEESVTSWKRAYDIAPDDLDVISGLGVVLTRAGQHSEAARMFALAMEKQPASRAAVINFGLAVRNAGLFNEVKNVVENKRPQLSGTLDRFQVPDLLDILINHRVRGTLQVRSGTVRASLSICEGRLLGGTAPGVPALARALIEAGALSITSYDALSESLEKSDKAFFLPCALIEHRLARAEAIRAAVDAQVVQVIRAMLAWKEGQFVFEDLEANTEVPADLLSVSVDARAVLFDVIRLADEEAR
jgi:hypothetical protein